MLSYFYPLPVTVHERVLFLGASRVDLCVSVRPSKQFDLVQVKTEMFYNGPPIAPLHFDLERSKVEVIDSEVAKCENVEIVPWLQLDHKGLIYLQVTAKIILAGPSVAALHTGTGY